MKRQLGDRMNITTEELIKSLSTLLNKKLNFVKSHLIADNCREIKFTDPNNNVGVLSVLEYYGTNHITITLDYAAAKTIPLYPMDKWNDPVVIKEYRDYFFIPSNQRRL